MDIGASPPAPITDANACVMIVGTGGRVRRYARA